MSRAAREPGDDKIPPMSVPDPIVMAQRQVVFPVVVSGPSGVGKTVLVQQLLRWDRGLINSISATSRPIRPGEADGRHYYFHDDAGFRALIASGGLLEWARVHEHFYGTPTRPLEEHLAAGRGVVLNIDVQGARQLRVSRPDAVLVFIVPPSLEVLEQRLRNRRTDSEADIARRLANAHGELAEADRYDYVVVNDTVRGAARDLLAIVRAERRRRERLVGAAD